MKLLFVTATNTNIGKTYATLKMIHHFSQQNIVVGVCKPIETGVDDIPKDAEKLLCAVQQYNPNFQQLTPKDITAYTFELPAAPFCADDEGVIAITQIKKKIESLAQRCDLLIIEGAGGLMVPITKSYCMIDLIEELNAKAMLITPSRLGCINDTLLSIEALERRGIDFEWMVNLFEDRESFERVTKPFYDVKFPDWKDLNQAIKGLDFHSL